VLQNAWLWLPEDGWFAGNSGADIDGSDDFVSRNLLPLRESGTLARADMPAAASAASVAAAVSYSSSCCRLRSRASSSLNVGLVGTVIGTEHGHPQKNRGERQKQNPNPTQHTTSK
jgi:hypothetical protein